MVDPKIALLGLVVGLLVGLTGTGGGALMTPLLIVFGWAQPMVAVGTDLLWSTLTKATGAGLHLRQKNVDFALVKYLLVGSVPGALAGVFLLAHISALGVHDAERLTVRVLGAALVMVAITLFLRCIRRPPESVSAARVPRHRPYLTIAVGAVVGFVVSLSSVGSGSLIIAALVALYPDMPMRRIVGSDIVNALLLSAVASLGHLGLRGINFPLLGTLLVGSIPGVLIGSRMTALMPDKVMRPLLAGMLLLLGCKLL